MKPICVKCERFYRCKKTGFYFIEGMPKHNGTPPGKAEPQNWQPYKLWSGDLWECPDCGAQTIAGCGQAPVSEHYEPHFRDDVKKLGATFQVNDC